MTLSTRLKTGICAIVLSGTVVSATGCSLGPNDLPLFRGTSGSGYEVTLQFSSAMNLPNGAHVMMDGLQVGAVRTVEVSGQSARVTAQLDDGTRVPSDIRAVIRQNTLLGDTYIGLDHDPIDASTGYLPPGATVPVDRTTSPPQLEDTIAVLAYFVNGGSIQRVQETMSKINTVMPPVADVRNMASMVAVDMRDLAQNTGEIDRFLTGLDSTAVSINDKSAIVSTMFSDSGLHFWHRWAANIVAYVSKALPAIGSIFEGGTWMVPMLDSLANSAGSIRTTWDDGPATTEKLSTFLRTTILPFAEQPSVNIRSVESVQGDQLIADVENVLRMLGAVK
ncbi:MlaD family protein [Rhodococcus aetherivorans]|uniref:MlaD family protein n=1 Tax=Rhodococcus aetherivorans TaxID=191292 RepID=UPI0002D21E6C|nr:MlaD family protein [Rhodococcus aetherivorans]CCW11338.1 MCE-family lipoprotein LprK (MCE-family lipoprotein Mce1e [Rhodococcus aetherivorans]